MASLLRTRKHRPHNPPANAPKKERTKNLGCVGLASHYFLRFHEFFSSILFWALIREVFYSLFDEFSIRFVDNLTIETSPERWFCHLMSLRVEMFCRWRSRTSGDREFHVWFREKGDQIVCDRWSDWVRIFMNEHAEWSIWEDFRSSVWNESVK